MSKVQHCAKHFILTCQTTSVLNISSYTHKLEGSECNSFLPFASFFIHSYEALQRRDHNTPRSKNVGPRFWNVSQCGLCSMDAMLNSYHSSQNICIVWPKEPKRNYVAERFANVATIKAQVYEREVVDTLLDCRNKCYVVLNHPATGILLLFVYRFIQQMCELIVKGTLFDKNKYAENMRAQMSNCFHHLQ